MSDAPLILGVSGLRGIVGESLTPEVAVRYAAAFGEWLVERYGPRARVVLARDGRRGGEVIQTAAATGLMSVGCVVIDIGRATTPTAGVAVDELAYAGMQVTASHNPQEWNGLKCFVRTGDDEVDACAPSTEITEQIITGFQSSSRKAQPADRYGVVTYEGDAVRAHINRVSGAMIEGDLDQQIEKGMFRICVDSVNTASADLAEEVAERYGCELIQLAGLTTGVFPHTPEPTAENLSGEGGLCDAVPGLKADVGFAQDPDGDRLAIVDEKGRYIGEEYTLVIAAEALLGAMGDEAKGAVLVTNLSTSRMVEDVAQSYGARVERTAVGEANVVERMKALKAAGERVVLGGEGNGGVIWPEVTYVRDSLGAMALTLGLMAREGKTVSEVVSMIDAKSAGGRGYAIVKRKQDLARKEDAVPAVERVAARYASERVDTQDGVRVDFGGDRAGSWVHVRASNTEPIMRLIAEAGDEAAAGAILDEVAGVIGGA